MIRVKDGAFQMEPYDPRYCGSDKKLKFCHPMTRNGEIPRPFPSNCSPPGRKTGFANPRCYAQQLSDCSTEMSGEHLFSEVTLNLLTGPDGKIVRSGYPWQDEGETQSLTPANCKANVLCKRHNNALSPVDDAAGRFLKTILRTPDFLQRNEIRALVLSGDDLERWILKTLCTHIVAIRKFGDSWQPPLSWLEVLWGMRPFSLGCGLYFNQSAGEPSLDAPRLGIRVLTCPGIDGPTGAIVQLGAHQLALAMVNPTPEQMPGSVLVTKYYRPTDFSISYQNCEVIYSLGWAAQTNPRRIRMSWAPNN